MELNICHLYPDILNLYGDRGNIITMKRRMEDRGIKVNVEGCSIGETLDANRYDIFFIGGGQDFEQEVLLKDLGTGKAAEIRAAVEDEKTFLAICGGYQMLGQYYKTWDGVQLDFTGAINIHTVGSKERMIGNYMFETLPESSGAVVVGFENHSGKTYLGEGVSPLGNAQRLRQQRRRPNRRSPLQKCLRNLFARLPFTKEPGTLRFYITNCPRTQIRSNRTTCATGRHPGIKRQRIHETKIKQIMLI